jgi:hypothetical protein
MARISRTDAPEHSRLTYRGETSGDNLVGVQYLAGHKQPTTTGRYMKTSPAQAVLKRDSAPSEHALVVGGGRLGGGSAGKARVATIGEAAGGGATTVARSVPGAAAETIGGGEGG